MITKSIFLNLHCDYPQCGVMGEFHGDNTTHAMDSARENRWGITRQAGDWLCRCPDHKGQWKPARRISR